MSQVMWQPCAEQIAAANLMAFMRQVNERWGLSLSSYRELHRWSVTRPEQFWALLWDYCGMRAARGYDAVVADFDRMPGARWFIGSKLNFTDNLLRFCDHRRAIVFCNEQGERRSLTFAELRQEVMDLAVALRGLGVTPGDRVAGYLPNLPEAVIAMLATVGLGAIWSSTSPDFGVEGVVDRFGQIAPRVLIAADGYVYGGKSFNSLARVREICTRIPSIEHVVVVPYIKPQLDLGGLPGGVHWSHLTSGDHEIAFESFPFDHPLHILSSSGTTGPPKCIVHSAGGILVQHFKEHTLHTDLRPDDRIFYFTTCGWMMWNWLVSALATGATVVLYDGSPLWPTPEVLFDLIDREQITVFGTSPRFISAVEKAGLAPIASHRLSSLRTILSTGSPLSGENFDFVYGKIKSDVRLSSITGGTDLCGCFAAGNPIGPVYRGELQCLVLGMDVQVYDDEGRPIVGRPGELVCRAPFPSMPLGFWNDADGRKYHQAYFEHFPGVWRHGDWAEITEHDGLVIHGRSDAVLNPGGVRIGTAEIYRQVEQLPEVLECVAVGQQCSGDVRVLLFVKLRDGLRLDEALIERIKLQIRRNTTPRHVPAEIRQVADIPRTRSGKIVELAVRDIIHDRPVHNREAIANPEALEEFRPRG
ncbi:MAG TPA: acetoacetate--CoA ligase [Pirellulales bacterium]|nr:acetoacetate--CoA ligase [Pirellulales bacterium]